MLRVLCALFLAAPVMSEGQGCGCSEEMIAALESRVVARVKRELLAQLQRPAEEPLDEQVEPAEGSPRMDGHVRRLSSNGPAGSPSPSYNQRAKDRQDSSVFENANSARLAIGGTALVGDVDGLHVNNTIRTHSLAVGGEDLMRANRTSTNGPGTTLFNAAQFFSANRIGSEREWPTGSMVYFHLRMPASFSAPNVNSDMFHVHVVGYAYSAASENRAIDLVFVGYKKWYETGSRLLRTNTYDTHSCCSEQHIYFGSNGELYLRFSVTNPYFTSFRVDSMYVGNGILHERNDITVVEALESEL